MFKIIFPCLIMTFLFSCFPKSRNVVRDKGAFACVESKDGKKNQLEKGIRSQVRFIGETERLSSIMEKMSEDSIPAVSLTLIHQGRIDWSDVYQNDAFPEQQELDCSNIFQAASLSKPATLLAAFRMQAEGKIDLDEDIENYLEEYTLPAGKQTPENPVTFRNILSHSSGITPGGYEGYPKQQKLPSDIDILLGKEGVNSPPVEVLYPPNEGQNYSGGAYTLAEVALQDIFEENFSNLMKKWLLNPIGMHQSTFSQPLPVADATRAAKGYTASGALVEGGWRNHPEQAAAGLWSNSMDVGLLLIEMYKGYHGKSDLFLQKDIQSIVSQKGGGNGYGFIVDRTEEGDICVTHFGGNEGYRTGMTISLTSGNGLVYLINSDNGVNLANALLLSAAKVYNWSHFQQTAVKRASVSSKDLQGLTGEYKWDDRIALSIQYNEAEELITLHFPVGDAYKLIPVEGEDLAFIHEISGTRLTFSSEDNFNSFSLYGRKAVRW